MQQIDVRPSNPTVVGLLGLTFPQQTSRHRRVTVCVYGRGDRSMSLVSCWSGSRHDTHCVVRLADDMTWQVPDNGSGYTIADEVYGPEGFPLRLPAPGYAVVTLTEGSRPSISVHLDISNTIALLPAPREGA